MAKCHVQSPICHYTGEYSTTNKALLAKFSCVSVFYQDPTKESAQLPPLFCAFYWELHYIYHPQAKYVSCVCSSVLEMTEDRLALLLGEKKHRRFFACRGFSSGGYCGILLHVTEARGLKL